MFNNIFSDNRAIDEICGKTWQRQTGQRWQKIRRMRFACCISKAAAIHTECVILTAFPRQQWLHDPVSMLRYTYIACLVLPTLCIVE